MRIKGIHLTNFRSYRDSVSINGFSEVNTFIGPNNAGKSNIFEAMRYLKVLAGLGNGARSFGELIFDRNTNLEMHINVIFSLSSTERTEILETLFKPGSGVSSEEVEKSPFLSEISCDFAIREIGVVEAYFEEGTNPHPHKP